MNADTAPVLSVNCSLRHLRKQSDEAKSVLGPMFDGIQAVAIARGYALQGLMEAIGNNTAKDIMEMVQIDAEAIREIDRKLHGMINQI